MDGAVIYAIYTLSSAFGVFILLHGVAALIRAVYGEEVEVVEDNNDSECRCR